MLATPLTLERLAKACRKCGLAPPAESADGRRFVTRARPSFLSLGEEIEIDVISPVEIAIRSTAVQPVPLIGLGNDVVRKLVHELRGLPTGLGLFG